MSPRKLSTCEGIFLRAELSAEAMRGEITFQAVPRLRIAFKGCPESSGKSVPGAL